MAKRVAWVARRRADGWPTLAPGAVDGWFAFGVLATRIPLVLVGSAGAALMIVIGMGMALLRPRQLLATFSQAWIIWLFPLFALLSTLWAVYPGITLRAGLQVVLTAAVGMMLGKSPRPGTTLIGLFFAYVGYTLLSLVANVQTGVGTFGGVGTEGMALVGIGGEAKNFFAGSAITGMLLSITLLWQGLGRWRLPVLAILAACAGACGVAVVRAHSAGALVSGAAGVAVLLATLVLRRLPSSAKLFLVAGAILALLLGYVFYDQIMGTIASGLSKGAGLTGRDYLWYRSTEQIRARPLLGLGYYGFWHESNADAIGLGRYFDLTEISSSFSFHNSYIQTLVELGRVGLVVLVAGWIASGYGLLRRFVLSTSVPGCFWIAFFAAEMVKSGVELIRPATLVAPSLMLFATLAYGLSPLPSNVAPAWRRKRAPARPPLPAATQA